MDDYDAYNDKTGISDKEWFKLDAEQDLLDKQKKRIIRN